MPLHRPAAAKGPLYLPPHPEEPEIAGAVPAAIACLLAGAALLIWAYLLASVMS